MIAASIDAIFIAWCWYRRFRPDLSYFVTQTALCLVISYIAVWITEGQVNKHIPSVTQVVDSWNLVAMRSSCGLSGSFVWGIGSFGGHIVYTVYIKNDDGSMTPRRITADGNTRIIEDSSLHNTGTWRRLEIVRDETSPLTNWAPHEYSRGFIDEITVPTGTVVQSFAAQ
jgi:hypothetical protein